MTIRAEGRKARQWAIQVVHISDPPLSSPAALALLSKKYFTLDKSIYSETRMTRLRNRFMKQQMKTPDEKGGLTCTICGLKGCLPKTNNKNKLATVDHVIELKCGGPWDDPNNFRVACYPCNIHRNNVQQIGKVLT